MILPLGRPVCMALVSTPEAIFGTGTLLVENILTSSSPLVPVNVLVKLLYRVRRCEQWRGRNMMLMRPQFSDEVVVSAVPTLAGRRLQLLIMATLLTLFMRAK